MPCTAGTPANCIAVGLEAVGGDVSKRKELNAAMAKASFASPRGPVQTVLLA